MRVVWKYPPEQFSYLRQSTYLTTKPKGPIRGWSGRGRWVRTLEELREVAKVAEALYEKGLCKFYRETFLLVGYEELEPTGHWSTYHRLFWWLKSHDRDVWPDGVYKPPSQPAEAINPKLLEDKDGDKGNWLLNSLLEGQSGRAPAADEPVHHILGGADH